MDFVQVFSNLGVPVACLVAFFYLFEKERDAHKEEMEKITQAVQNNTTILQRLLDKL